MKQNKLTPVTIHDYFSDKLRKDMAAFNDDLAANHAGRAKLETAADELRERATSGELDKPEKLLADAEKLRATSVALDVEEIRLVGRKHAFQSPVREARSAERERVSDMLKKRVAEIESGLDAIAKGTRYKNGVVNENPEVVALRAKQGSVSGFVKVVTEADEARLAELQARVQAVVPSFSVKHEANAGRIVETVPAGFGR